MNTTKKRKTEGRAYAEDGRYLGYQEFPPYTPEQIVRAAMLSEYENAASVTVKHP